MPARDEPDEKPDEKPERDGGRASEGESQDAFAAEFEPEFAGPEYAKPGSDAADYAAAEEEDDGVREVPARVRRTARIPVFMLAGAVVGILVAAILTFSYPPIQEYSQGQIFAFLAVFIGVAGLGIGGLVGVIANSVVSRRNRGDVTLRRGDA